MFIESKKSELFFVFFNFEIKNSQRSVGARLAGDIAEKFGREGFPEKIILNFKGNAGQSFGCWNSKGVELKLNGLANDYVGKGMNGGKIVITKNILAIDFCGNYFIINKIFNLISK